MELSNPMLMADQNMLQWTVYLERTLAIATIRQIQNSFEYAEM